MQLLNNQISNQSQDQSKSLAVQNPKKRAIYEKQIWLSQKEIENKVPQVLFEMGISSLGVGLFVQKIIASCLLRKSACGSHLEVCITDSFFMSKERLAETWKVKKQKVIDIEKKALQRGVTVSTGTASGRKVALSKIFLEKLGVSQIVQTKKKTSPRKPTKVVTNPVNQSSEIPPDRVEQKSSTNWNKAVWRQLPFNQLGANRLITSSETIVSKVKRQLSHNLRANRLHRSYIKEVNKKNNNIATSDTEKGDKVAGTVLSNHNLFSTLKKEKALEEQKKAREAQEQQKLERELREQARASQQQNKDKPPVKYQRQELFSIFLSFCSSSSFNWGAVWKLVDWSMHESKEKEVIDYMQRLFGDGKPTLKETAPRGFTDEQSIIKLIDCIKNGKDFYTIRQAKEVIEPLKQVNMSAESIKRFKEKAAVFKNNLKKI